MKRIVVSGAVIYSLFLMLVPAAGASDGVLEINQACADNTGCFTGDSAGFPVEIDGSVGRSYRLTSDLVLPSASVSGITISVPSVSIDLNGFEIVTAECVGATSNCTPGSGNGDGIGFTAPGDGDNRGISVKNGSVTGMGDDGLKLGKQAEVINVRTRWNGSYGIYAEDGSTVTGSAAYENAVDGIHVLDGSIAAYNIVYLNGSDGIDASERCRVFGNTVGSSGSNGISAGSGSTVTGNTVMDNAVDGIWADQGSTVSGNAAYSNTGDGIQAEEGAVVSGNTARNNSQLGLRLEATASYLGNNVSNNTAGTVSGGVDAGGNVCDGTTTCPEHRKFKRRFRRVR